MYFMKWSIPYLTYQTISLNKKHQRYLHNSICQLKKHKSHIFSILETVKLRYEPLSNLKE